MMSDSRLDGVKLDREKVEKVAYNNWPEIYGKLAPELNSAVAINGHVDCPFPNRHKVSGGLKKFRLDKKGHRGAVGSAICSCGSWSTGITLLMDLNGETYRSNLEDLAVVMGYLGDKETPNLKNLEERMKKVSLKPVVNMDEDSRKKEAILKTWSKTIPLNDPDAKPARLYLESRGVSANLDNNANVRFHSNLPFYEGDSDGKLQCYGYFPAIVCAIRNADGNPITLHRIYLTEDGSKAPFSNVKKMMEIPDSYSTEGCVIDLSPNDKRTYVGVAEGIETAEAVTTAMNELGWNMPMKCTVNAVLMEKFIPSEGIKICYIWADKDISKRGHEAATNLKKRLWKKGIKSMILMPKQEIKPGEKSIDWNDVLVEYGADGFPLPNNSQQVSYG